MEADLQNPNGDGGALPFFLDDVDSSCSTPFASAPSSPGRSSSGGGGGGYFFSAPASPIHHLLLSSAGAAGGGGGGGGGDAEFEFGGPGGPMISADELFLNGQIRPLRLAPLPDLDEDGGEDSAASPPVARGRDLTLRSGSVHRRSRSMSPLRKASPRLQLFPWRGDPRRGDGAPAEEPDPDAKREPGGESATEEAAPPVTASSRSSSSSSSSSAASASSSSRASRRWVFIKDLLLHRSKSEGHDQAGTGKADKFWPFSPSWSSAPSRHKPKLPAAAEKPPAGAAAGGARRRARAPRSTVASAHERLYAANRAQAEEMRRRTFLPYRQGLLGCLGLSSRSYGALHGFAKTLNPVFSR